MADNSEEQQISSPPPQSTSPAVSVIIPVYNAEKYVGECLDSLLAQTFTNFEVIVIDDCSTDNSAAIVESYREKFGGRLKFYSNEKNSGPGASRNKGLMLSRGEYIYCLDADDMYTPTALEESYPLAKKYDADVIFYPINYKMSDDGLTKEIQKLSIYRDSQKNILDESLTKRIDNILIGRYGRATWRVSAQRDFLIENELFFPDTKPDQDVIRNLGVFVHAKRILRILNPIYVYRRSKNSTIRRKKTLTEAVNFWLNPVIVGLKSLNNLVNKHEFMNENPQYLYGCLKALVAKEFGGVLKASEQLDSATVYEAIKQEYGARLGEHDVLVSALCTYINDLQKSYKCDAEVVSKFKVYFTARIDIKLETTEGDFQMVNVSDKRATVWKPGWLQKGGVGYQIQTYTGNITIVAKSTVDGQITLKLRGLDIHKPKEKRIPYWIDYTNFAINENVVFDTLTPAWHDKPYVYTFDVKADAEIKIQVEWLPHRSDT